MFSITCRAVTVLASLILLAGPEPGMSSTTKRTVLREPWKSSRLGPVGNPGSPADRPLSGTCTMQPTWLGCRICCDVEERFGRVFHAGCVGVATGGGRVLGSGAGPAGSVAGGAAGAAFGVAVCDLMFRDALCYHRCIGKDGDPDPIACSAPGNPDETGVCRQVCEQGQHDVGPGDCATGGQIELTCCVYEYDPPDGDPCPEEICPGPACPPECDDTLP